MRNGKTRLPIGEPASLVATRSPGVIPGRSAHRDDGGLGTGSNGAPTRSVVASIVDFERHTTRSFMSISPGRARRRSRVPLHATATGRRRSTVEWTCRHIGPRAAGSDRFITVSRTSSPERTTWLTLRHRISSHLAMKGDAEIHYSPRSRGRKTLGRWPGDCCGALGGARDFQRGFNEELRVGFDRLLNRVGDPWQSTLPGGEGRGGTSAPPLPSAILLPWARDGRSRSPAVSCVRLVTPSSRCRSAGHCAWRPTYQ